MSVEHLLNAIDVKLRANSDIAAIVGEHIDYGRGPVDNTWPQIIYFDLPEIPGYRVDYNAVTIQFSAWSLDKYQALRMRVLLTDLFLRFNGDVTIPAGTVHINWSELIDSGALPESDPQLFGQFLRFTFRYRGTNLGGL